MVLRWGRRRRVSHLPLVAVALLVPALSAGAAAGIAVAASSVSAATSSTASAWVEYPPATVPSPFTDEAPMAIASEPSNGDVLMVESASDSADSSTWQWDGSTWTTLSDTSLNGVGPAMAGDPATGNVVYFGGQNSLGTISTRTYVWSGSSWVLQTPTVHPSAGISPAMAYDPSQHDLVLLEENASTSKMETWTWNGSSWAQQFPAHTPSLRTDFSMTTDTADDDVVLFGGTGPDDTWTWNGTDWTQHLPRRSPPTRTGAGLAEDPATGDVVLSGGFQSGSNYLDDTWTWNGTDWTKQHPVTHAPAGTGLPPLTTVDPSDGRVVTFDDDLNAWELVDDYTGVACRHLSGNISTVADLSRCVPSSGSNTGATIPGASLTTGTATVTWSPSGQTSVLSITARAQSPQGSCPGGDTETVLFGIVTGGSSTYTRTGDHVSMAFCETSSGKLELAQYPLASFAFF